MSELNALDRLRLFEPSLRAAGLTVLYLFGSVARGEARSDSDVDLLFEADPACRLSLLDQARLQVELADAIGRPVDQIEREALHSYVRRRADHEMIRIF